MISEPHRLFHDPSEVSPVISTLPFHKFFHHPNNYLQSVLNKEPNSLTFQFLLSLPSLLGYGWGLPCSSLKSSIQSIRYSLNMSKAHRSPTSKHRHISPPFSSASNPTSIGTASLGLLQPGHVGELHGGFQILATVFADAKSVHVG